MDVILDEILGIRKTSIFSDEVFTPVKLTLGNGNLSVLPNEIIIQILISLPIEHMRNFVLSSDSIRQVCTTNRNYISKLLHQKISDQLKKIIPESKGNLDYTDKDNNENILMLMARQLSKHAFAFSMGSFKKDSEKSYTSLEKFFFTVIYLMNINSVDCNGYSILMTMAYCPITCTHLHCSKKFNPILLTRYKKVIDAGADLNILDKRGETLLMGIITFLCNIGQWSNDVYHFYLKIVDIILDKGADVNLVSEGFDSPLMLAILLRNFSLVKKLLEKGADVDFVNPNDDTPIRYSLYESQDKEITKELIKYKVKKSGEVFDEVKMLFLIPGGENHITKWNRNVIPTDDEISDVIDKNWDFWISHMDFDDVN